MSFVTASRRALGGSVAALALALVACDDDPNENGGGPGETEVITEVSLTLTPEGGAAQTATITDPDGIGPQNPLPQQGALVLTPGQSYVGSVTFTDATTTPPEDITAEVEEEAEAHRVFYTVDDVHAATVVVSDLDTDDNGAPLGLTFTLSASDDVVSGADGTINVVLSHYDEEPKGSGNVPSEETDVNVTFDFQIE